MRSALLARSPRQGSCGGGSTGPGQSNIALCTCLTLAWLDLLSPLLLVLPLIVVGALSFRQRRGPMLRLPANLAMWLWARNLLAPSKCRGVGSCAPSAKTSSDALPNGLPLAHGAAGGRSLGSSAPSIAECGGVHEAYAGMSLVGASSVEAGWHLVVDQLHTAPLRRTLAGVNHCRHGEIDVCLASRVLVGCSASRSSSSDPSSPMSLFIPPTAGVLDGPAGLDHWVSVRPSEAWRRNDVPHAYHAVS